MRVVRAVAQAHGGFVFRNHGDHARIDLSALYIIDNNLPVMSLSTGCEPRRRHQRLSQCAMEQGRRGITAVIRGDSGSGGCDYAQRVRLPRICLAVTARLDSLQRRGSERTQ